MKSRLGSVLIVVGLLGGVGVGSDVVSTSSSEVSQQAGTKFTMVIWQ